LSPISFLAAISLLRVTPYVTALLLDPTVMDPRVADYIGDDAFNSVLSMYLACELFSAMIFFKILGATRYNWLGRFPVARRPNKPSSLMAIGLLIVFGLISVGLRVQAAGGLSFLLANLALRAEITAGYGFLVIPAYACFAIAAVTSIQRLGIYHRWFDWLVFLIVVAIGGLGMSVFGGRKDALLLLCTALIAYSVFVKPLRWNAPVFPIAFICVVAYSYFLGSARELGGLGAVSADPLAILGDSIKNFSAFFKTISYVDTYLFIVAHFERAAHWGIAIFQNLPVSFLPSLLFPNKPPVDEGVYIKSLLEGYTVFPPMPAADLYPSSLPPETFGNGYAAFGPIGVMLFFAIKAFCFRWAFRVRFRNWIVLPVVFLVYFSYNFQISPLRFIQVLQVVLVCMAINFIVEFSRRAMK
jgi:hypothetical protein